MKTKEVEKRIVVYAEPIIKDLNLKGYLIPLSEMDKMPKGMWEVQFEIRFKPLKVNDTP
jgi:hypothetical protein